MGSSAPAVSVSDRADRHSDHTVQVDSRANWGSVTSTPVVRSNRFAALTSGTDDEGHTTDGEQPFTTVVAKRSKRSRQSPMQPVAASSARSTEQVRSDQRRRATLVYGKSTSGSVISAAKKLRKKVVLCVDNVNVNCSAENMSSFISSLSVEAVTCFEVKSRRRRNESADVVDRKAFRVCIFKDDLDRFLNANAWPDSITISEWFFKPQTANVINRSANNEEKRRRVGNGSPSHSVGPLISEDPTVVHARACDVDVDAESVTHVVVTDTDAADATVLVNYNETYMDCNQSANDGM